VSLSFGIVITHSVSTAGVLLVFVFLVVPAIATIMITDKLWLQLVLGWSMGTLVSMLGLFASYVADLPSGPAVVATYGLVLLITTLGVYLFRATRKTVALKNITLGFTVFLLAMLVFWIMGQGFKEKIDHEHQIPEHVDLHAQYHAKQDFLTLTDSDLQEILSKSNKPDSLVILYNRIENPFQRFEIAHKMYDLNTKLGSQKLIDFLDFCKIPFLRQKALDILITESRDTFGYDALKDHDANVLALEKWHKWWINRYGRE